MVIMIRRSQEWWELRGQRADFSCLSASWFLDRVRWQPAHRPFALGAAPKGINQLAVSTQILASVTVIYTLRKQPGTHNKTIKRLQHVWFAPVFREETALRLCTGYNWILGRNSSDLCCTSPLSVLAGGSCEEEYDGKRECTAGKLSYTALCSLIRFHLLFWSVAPYQRAWQILISCSCQSGAPIVPLNNSTVTMGSR